MNMNEHHGISININEHVNLKKMGQLGATVARAGVCASIGTFVLLLVRYAATVGKGFSNMCVEIHEYQ